MKWRWGKKSVTICLSLDQATYLGEVLNEWASLKGWTDREDCQGWKRSPIARENRRESIVYGNCLGAISTALGRDEVAKLREMARAEASAALSEV